MPVHFGKIFAAISLITVAAFLLWLLFTTFFATEQADEKIEQHGPSWLPSPTPTGKCERAGACFQRRSRTSRMRVESCAWVIGF